MRSISFLLVLSAVTLAAGSIPLRKQMFFEREIESEQPAVPFIDPTSGLAYRLPNDTFPIHYDIHLETNIHSGNFAFNGVVEILLEAREVTSNITLHYRQIQINQVDLLTVNDENIESEIIFILDEPRDFLIIPTKAPLAIETKYKVIIQYEGTLRTDDAGFYRSSYKNSDGETVWLATTQFESTDARHGFPCYDEPSIKATYTVFLKYDKSYRAISNMPEESRLPVEGSSYVISKFEKSFQFQSYLVAFVISNFDFIASEGAKLPQRVFATPHHVAGGYVDFALEYGIQSIQVLENYLGVDFLLPKIDQIAIPDFAAGAMENYGLVTYRETALLYSNVTNTVDRKMRVAAVIAHEYAHQWFGNHVSPAWWHYLWLNEGFATLFESYATGLVFPEWRSMETFVTGTLQGVMISDAGDPRAMTHYVESPLAISDLFDNVAYPKSGSVLRMLQTVMTEATFAKGLKLYLDEKKESFASPEDLYRNLQTAFSLENPSSTLNIADFMTTWELQPGFPVVSVARINEVLTLTQERYHQNKTTDDTNSIWSIPISYVVGSTPEFNITTPDIWLNEKTLSVQNPNAPKPWTANDWILLNIQETGYYRVNYDMNLWKLLIDELNTGDYTKIHQVNRAQLIDDSFNLARSQRLQYSVPLDIFVYLKQEVDYIPWASTNRALNFLRPYLISSQFYKHFEILVARSMDKFYASLGAETKDTDLFLDKFGRNIAINWACIMGHEQCLADTTSQMERVSNSELTIVPDLETAIYCNGLRGASHTTLMAMYNLALKPENNLRRVLMLSSLSCTRNAEFLRFYLDTSVDPTISFYNDADRLLVISSLIINGGLSGIDLVLNFLIKTKLSTLEHVFADGMNNIMSSLANKVSNNDHFVKVAGLLTILQNHELLSKQNCDTHLATAKNRMVWIEQNLPSIETWLSANVHPDLPNSTEEGPTTIFIESTTNGRETIKISCFAVFIAFLIKILF